jgi:hypothetical protein
MIRQLLQNTNKMLQYAPVHHSDFGGAELAQLRPCLVRPRSLPPPNPKYFLLHTSHQIFRRMHGALNVGKKDN